MPIRIHVADPHEADAVWALLQQASDDVFCAAEVHLDGHGLLWTATRTAAGLLTTLAPAPQARSCPSAGLAAP